MNKLKKIIKLILDLLKPSEDERLKQSYKEMLNELKVKHDVLNTKIVASDNNIHDVNLYSKQLYANEGKQIELYTEFGKKILGFTGYGSSNVRR